MNTQHLDGDELDRLLAGEELPPAVSQHLESCLVCWRRRESFLSAVVAARHADPEEGMLAGLRESALDAWPGGSQPRRVAWRWVAAAAAAVVIAVAASFWSVSPTPDDFNPEAVMAEVDEMLERDPLTLIAPEELVEVVLTEDEAPVQEDVS